MAMKTTVVKEDPESGELFIEFDDETIAELGWEIGDTVEWIENSDGTWTIQTIQKVDNDKDL